MKYAVVSAVVTDEIHFTDKTVKKVPGGAGIYALCGIKLWNDDVQVVTGVGEDYEEIHGEWYRNNNISMDGLKIKHQKSPYTVIQYFEDGEREETPRYGEEHFHMLETSWQELQPYIEGYDGVYIFKNADSFFWPRILYIKKTVKCKVMWEIAADAAVRSNYKKVKKIAAQLEGFSINYTEAKNLLGLDDVDKIVEEFQSWEVGLIFLRCGEKGAVMITSSETVKVPAQPHVQVVDPTGGGNSSTGAVLCGMVEGYSPEICGKMGSIAAAMCISQYGVPEFITKEMKEKARLEAGIEV